MNKAISPYLSRKIKTLSFLLMVMIVVLHSNMLSLSSGFNYYLQLFVTNGVTRTAVPIFFMVSGLLFFVTTDNYDVAFFVRKIKSRTRTVLLPFLVWSLIGFIFISTLQSIPLLRPWFSGKPVEWTAFPQIIKALLWEPIGSYQLWFLRDLFLIFLISPLIYLTICKLRFYPILLLIAYWLSGHNLWAIQSESITFFSIGCYFAIYGRSYLEKKAPIQWVVLFLLCWIVGSSIVTLTSRNHTIYYFNIIAGVITIWTAYDHISWNLNKKLDELALPFTFFIFIFHEPLLTVIKKIFLFLLGANDAAILIIYLMAPIITISICISTGFAIKKHWPRSYSFLTGSR